MVKQVSAGIAAAITALILLVDRKVARAACCATMATLGLLAATAMPAHAATSESDAWWNDAPVAKAWFNSGNSNPSKGPNSFTVKGESEADHAVLSYWIDGIEQDQVFVWGSGNEQTFSLAPSPTTVHQLSFVVCGWVGDNHYCDHLAHDDTIR
jgi:hypothetical protein